MKEDHEFMNTAVGLVWRDMVITQAHIGGHSYVLVGADGTYFKIAKPEIDFFLHIQEFDLSYTKQDGTPAYALDTLHEKLSNLVGNRDLYRMVQPYWTVVVEVIDSLANYDGSEYDTGVLNGMGAILVSDSVAREINIRMQSDHSAVQDQAKKANHGMAKIKSQITETDRLESLRYYDNPLIVWAAAAISDFFTDSELPRVFEFLRQNFSLTEDHFFGAGAMGSCLNVLQHHSVPRFVNFVLSMRESIHDPDPLFYAFRDGLARCGCKVELAERS
jgi:hypothetical protein